jgi:hypothetical protein
VSALKQAEILVKEASMTARISYGKVSREPDNTSINYFFGQINAYDGLIYEIHKAIKNLEKEYKEG